ncbi:MAG: hypothetical protein ISS89_02425 [Candidatus Omnitrophica bacterium]|nr:hypothetical protein [Candidatus Omnitrophota bacterium]
MVELNYIVKFLAKLIFLITGRKPNRDLDNWLLAECIIGYAALISKSIVVLGIIISIYMGVSNLSITQRNVELTNQPFVSIESGRWWKEPSDRFSAIFKMVNYGNKTAKEVKIRNFRILVVSIDKENIIKKIEQKINNSQKQYLTEYYLDEKNKLCLQLMQILSDYFRINPDATNSQLKEYISNLKSSSKELIGKYALIEQSQLLFNVAEINNDLSEYYSIQSHLLYPKQPRGQELRQQMGEGGMNGVIKGNNLLVIFFSIEYYGFLKDKRYSTCYIGYTLRNDIDPSSKTWDDFTEFKTWESEDRR